MTDHSFGLRGRCLTSPLPRRSNEKENDQLPTATSSAAEVDDEQNEEGELETVDPAAALQKDLNAFFADFSEDWGKLLKESDNSLKDEHEYVNNTNFVNGLLPEIEARSAPQTLETLFGKRRKVFNPSTAQNRRRNAGAISLPTPSVAASALDWEPIMPLSGAIFPAPVNLNPTMPVLVGANTINQNLNTNVEPCSTLDLDYDFGDLYS